MINETNETVVEKVTHYVKDMLGIFDPEASTEKAPKPEYDEIAPALHFNDESVEATRLGAAPGLTTSGAMRIEPVNHSQPLVAEPSISGDHDRIAFDHEKTATELNAESAAREDGV